MPKRNSKLYTPQSFNKSGKKVSRSIPRLSMSAKVPAKMAKYIPYVGPAISAAQGAYRGYKYARSAYRAVRPKRTSKKLRSMGASNSKSAGYFRTNGLKSMKIDKYLNNGVVYHREHGDVITDASRQAVYVAHSTAPKRSIVRAGFGALVKLLFKKAGIKIKNWDSPILNGANIPARIELQYKIHDGTPVGLIAFNMTTSYTLTNLVEDMVTWIGNFSSALFPQQFVRITYYHDIGTLGSSRLLAYDIDLTSTTLEYLCLSHLKIQNRTVNSTGNDQADDVDNVPIYGRSFDVSYNGTTFRDYNNPLLSGQPQLRTDIDFGTMDYSTPASDIDTTLYKEVALPKQFVGVTSSGNAHLDPGEIKTSKLANSVTLSFNKLITLYKSKGLENGVIFFLGKTRIFGFEKMINAVAMSSTNQFNLAIETDLKIGCLCRTRDNHQTAMKTETYTGKL